MRTREWDMAKPKTIRPCIPEQSLLLPPSPADWLPENLRKMKHPNTRISYYILIKDLPGKIRRVIINGYDFKILK